MAEIYNIYCDESCHLERDKTTFMMLGAVWCPTSMLPEIAGGLREIKRRHGMMNRPEAPFPYIETKWTKVSQKKLPFYLDVVDFFFDNDDLHFRAILIEKSLINHEGWDQTHNDWYYKMMFRMIEQVVDRQDSYRVFLDIKDTRGERKRAKLEEVLRNSFHDWNRQIIQLVQQIRSHESEVLQLADLLIGAVGFHNREAIGEFDSPRSEVKREVVRKIRSRSRKTLEATTWLQERKFNILRWLPGAHQ